MESTRVVPGTFAAADAARRRADAATSVLTLIVVLAPIQK
jgi:hypothetical protein